MYNCTIYIDRDSCCLYWVCKLDVFLHYLPMQIKFIQTDTVFNASIHEYNLKCMKDVPTESA